ncbi:DUF1697 domain-containing protein [Heyndrickxia oleronia]|uniref:DUF1697 domain-containing protein n=1 Tax=Heyndrickxia oleronia TaxID=38875 RepID=UPI001B2F80D3|nr:DUF1697 domain-containing protein [Heyndrickxia oleronia]GIN40715.1 hypothetical protein J19TS1_36640 [Heyndrickxia oleronia]
MTVFIALLRGINVGGKNKIKMAELREMFEKLGYIPVKTYIQSGNILFQSNEGEDELRKKIEHQIEEEFGISINVILRTASEMEQIIQNCPFSEEALSQAKEAAPDVETLYVTLLLEAPNPENVELLEEYQSERDQFKVIGREVFLLYHHSVRDSKLATNLHKLNVPATTRNWKTINKLVTMAKEMEGFRY